MARRQLEIEGTRNDKDIPLAVVEAGQGWLEKRREQRRARENTAEALAGVIALMEANKIDLYTVVDTETGDRLKIKLKTKVTLTATRDRDGEGEEFDIGEGVDAFSDTAPGPHPNLIAQAEADQAAAGVAENEDGDVVTPDTAAPKGKRGRKPKKPAKATTEESGQGDGLDDHSDPVITKGDGTKSSVPKRGGDSEAIES